MAAKRHCVEPKIEFTVTVACEGTVSFNYLQNDDLIFAQLCCLKTIYTHLYVTNQLDLRKICTALQWQLHVKVLSEGHCVGNGVLILAGTVMPLQHHRRFIMAVACEGIVRHTYFENGVLILAGTAVAVARIKAGSVTMASYMSTM